MNLELPLQVPTRAEGDIQDLEIAQRLMCPLHEPAAKGPEYKLDWLDSRWRFFWVTEIYQVE